MKRRINDVDYDIENSTLIASDYESDYKMTSNRYRYVELRYMEEKRGIKHFFAYHHIRWQGEDEGDWIQPLSHESAEDLSVSLEFESEFEGFFENKDNQREQLIALCEINGIEDKEFFKVVTNGCYKDITTYLKEHPELRAKVFALRKDPDFLTDWKTQWIKWVEKGL